MTGSSPAGALAATGLAGAFLSGDWEPDGMARRAQRALRDRRGWVKELAHVVWAGHATAPLDRPRELARFIQACDPFIDHLDDPDRPMRIRVWMPAPTAMGPTRWPVPALPDRAALAQFLGLSTGHLAWFADARSMERTATDERLRHHRRQWIRKRDGSVRLLESPKSDLKLLQRRVLREVLDRIPPHDAAHGFRAGRSARTGALRHRGRPVVIRLDLESFFTSVTAGRVYGIFRGAGYPEPVAHQLAALCTTVTPPDVLGAAPPVRDALLERRRRMLHALRSPHLAQGAPTSPALANLAAFALDRRLAGLAGRLDATYTRYADDLVLSGSRSLARASSAIVRLVEEIAHDEGFRVHQDKTRVFTAAQRQLVTGLVVNDGANVARPDYDRLRAVLHDAALRGPEIANREAHPDFRAHLLGRIAWAGEGNPARATKLARAFAAIEW